MLKRIAKPLVVSLLICLALPGCSVFSSKNRRQQLAYQKYVRKHMRERQRQILRSQKAALRNARHITPSEPRISATVESVAEPVADPITVPPSTTSESDSTQAEP
jgi:hypothetical protein